MAKGSKNEPFSDRSRRLRGSGGVADWMQCDAALLQRAVERASLAGGALRFGYSRDGGAYAIGIYGDGDTYTVFKSPSEDINVTLVDISDLFDEIADKQLKDRGHKGSEDAKKAPF